MGSGEGKTISGGGFDREVVTWLECVSGEKLGDRPLGEWLRDGQVLCRVANVIQPGIVPRINTSTMPFKQMENVSAFIKACRSLGVLEKDVFSTIDLYEEKDLEVVKRCIYNLGSVVRKTVPSFNGPYLGVAQNSRVQDSKRQVDAATANQCGGLRTDI